MKTAFLYVTAFMALAACEGERQHHAGEEHLLPEKQPRSSGIMLTETQVRLANVEVGRVTSTQAGQRVVINARVTVDRRKSEVVSSRAGGRIEKLFVKQTGEYVRKGQPLYTIYSEVLQTLQMEYMLARQRYEQHHGQSAESKSLLVAAERKLLRYGLSESQIRELNGKEQARENITFRSPVAGIITKINAVEGEYAEEGTALFNLEDLSSLWVEGELYAGAHARINVGDKVNIRMPGTQGEWIETKIDFVSPEYRNNTQTMTVRAAIDNPNLVVKPGQHAEIYLLSPRKTITVPVDAIIRDGGGSRAFVKTDKNTFIPRSVRTGMEDARRIEVLEGLQEGDSIVVSGAYLLYSEAGG